MQRSSLATATSTSPLFLQAVVRPRGMNHKRSMTMVVSLTSLIDAFTVIVFFIMLNPVTSNDNAQVTKGMTLPAALHTEALAPGPVVRVEGDMYYVNDKPVTKENLRQVLAQFAPQNDQEKLTKALILQADKRAAFSSFNHIILAAAQNNIQKFQFLVLPNGK